MRAAALIHNPFIDSARRARAARAGRGEKWARYQRIASHNEPFELVRREQAPDNWPAETVSSPRCRWSWRRRRCAVMQRQRVAARKHLHRSCNGRRRTLALRPGAGTAREIASPALAVLQQ